MQPGILVRSRLNSLGTGKLQDVSYSDAQIEYFVSVGERIQQSVPVSSLERVILQRHTRCYLWSEKRESWLIGRIYKWHDDEHRYEIDLPDGKFCYAFEQDIHVRCNRPIDDPTEVLILRGHDTPFFYDRRSNFVRCLIEQRAVSRGMPGLLSANIELYPHQVEVVRRVLEDSIQRYLLADEVGLGKTIEAGVILRQYLLDNPAGRVLVIAPKLLLKQWQQELEAKFYLSDKIDWLTIEDIRSTHIQFQPDFLVLDEAQHIAGMAVSPNSAQRECFEFCRKLAHQAKQVLLLSATPALNHEQAFLAMLHLLDPMTYRLEDLDSFKERVRLRQDIGRVLLSFKEDASSFVLKMTLSKLKNLFNSDERLSLLLNQLENILQDPQVNSEEQSRVIRSIRTHISDTYRLHRRMLRNRRESLEDVLLDQSGVIPKVEYDEDERSPIVHEYLDEWRVRALGMKNDPDYQDWQQLRAVFLLLFRASGTELGLLQELISARLGGVVSPTLIPDFGAEAESFLKTPLFPGESNILQTLLDNLQQQPEFGDRIDQLQVVLTTLRTKNGDRPFKAVVFTSFSYTCQKIVARLKEAFEQEAIATYQVGQSIDEVEANTTQFLESPRCFVLVCDASGEEGHNLQFADWMIHFDLPWSPNRLEQRHGRMNRIGRRQLMNYVVFAGADVGDSLHDAWFQVLKDGFKIFQESIASLQFYVDRKLPDLAEALFESGAYGLKQSIAIVHDEIHREKVSIDEQNALDEIDALEESAAQYFQELEDYDSQHRKLKQAVEGWVYEALQFKREFQDGQDQNSDDIFAYRPSLKGRRETLVPVKDLYSLFSSSFAETGTYNRRKALQQPGVSVYRIGHPLLDALAHFVRWDDRGQAFALWRHEESWPSSEGAEWVGFRFDYVVETNLSKLDEVLQSHGWPQSNRTALIRRTDALFPPSVETLVMTTGMQPVTDPKLLEILQRPYSQHREPTRDYNLAKDRSFVLDEFISQDDWEYFCRGTRSRSEKLLRERQQFRDRCQRYATQAKRKLGDRVEQLRLRLERQAQAHSDSLLAQEYELEKALSQIFVQGILTPAIRLDSVGFYIVSGRPPKLPNGEAQPQ